MHIATTHATTDAARLCDRIAIMDHGRIIAIDTPRGLRRLLPAEQGIELTIDADGADPSAIFAAVAERVEASVDGEGRWTVRLYGAGEGMAAQAVAVSERSGGELVGLRRI